MSLHVALFAREPVAGQTKTRLVPALGAEGACALYEAFLDDVAATTQQLRALHPDVELALHSAEAQPGPGLQARAERWGMALTAQRGETLGDRMSHALSVGIARSGAALVLGTDVPTLPLGILLAAREALRAPPDTADATSAGPARGAASAPWCLGPAADDGYFLVGARHAPPSFEGVRMGTRHALSDTLRANPARPVTRLAPWYDVDTPSDLRLLRLHLGLDPRAAPATAAILR
jgi:glycosyltransferase A (GT-A) superfamily protein (DUF2064 family)